MDNKEKLTHLWVFDRNKRIYADKDSSGYRKLIYRHHWVKTKIIDETSVSFVLNNYGKVNKKKLFAKELTAKYLISEEEVDADVYVQDNRAEIASMIMSMNDCEKLKKVAELIGYKE